MLSFVFVLMGCGCFALKQHRCFVCCSVAGCFFFVCVGLLRVRCLLCCLCVFVTTWLFCVFNVMLFVFVRVCVCAVLREFWFVCGSVTGLSFCVVCCNVLCEVCVLCVC